MDIDLSFINIITLIPALVHHYCKLPAKLVSSAFKAKKSSRTWASDEKESSDSTDVVQSSGLGLGPSMTNSRAGIKSE